MILVSDEDRRRAFTAWLRTGHLPVVQDEEGVELKFNPWHDPQDGRFTFANTGRHYGWGNGMPSRDGGGKHTRMGPRGSEPRAADQIRPPKGLSPGPGRGSNSRAFEDPMTLEQVFPGLQGSAGSTIVAVADNILDLSGPANAAQLEIIDNHAVVLIEQIKAADPSWRLDELGPITSIVGRINRLNDLRWQRAVVLFRVRHDIGPLEVETLRFVQQRTDTAYVRGESLLKAGRLSIRLSEQEALGNYIDREVRADLRERYSRLGIDSAGAGPVRVNRRENNSSGGDLTYRRPDARVGDVAFDVTLTRKTASTPQVRGFFDTDFRPSRVVIIRPSQLGEAHTYVIPRPENKR